MSKSLKSFIFLVIIKSMPYLFAHIATRASSKSLVFKS